MEMIRRHVVITGRVQGVWFRGTTQEQALDNGVTGWVRNLRDGSVEAVFEGVESDVENVVQWCRKGPSLANVIEVRVIPGKYTGEFDTFSVR